jgi:alkanesulfonate monooxygenase SsuD/methylene tetrahydromethanopterin reductase-like flavin-dependent oxidoreductase (luciferase family)
LDEIKLGVHIPVMGFTSNQPTKEQIISLAQYAETLGYNSLSINDHIVFHTSWLDAISTLSAVAASTRHILVGTSILNIVVRNPIVCAKALAAIDILSSGRLFAGVGPGSYRGDYEACGIDFNERWSRFSEALQMIVMMLTSSDNNNDKDMLFAYKGRYYTLKDALLTPTPVQKPHPPIYVGSWGSDVGLKRLAKYSNGWMASAYNITPAKFKEKWNFLLAYRKSLGKEEDELFDNSIVSMFGYIHDDKDKVHKVVSEILAPALRRPAEDLEQMLLFGSIDDCLRKVRNLVDAGVKRVHFWPVLDYEDQIRIFKNGMSAGL